jgi:hypothetical protein
LKTSRIKKLGTGIRFQRRDLRVIASCLLAICAYIHGVIIGYTPPALHLICITVIYLSSIPNRIIHPKNVLFGFHMLWYTFPVMYATRYSEFSFTSYEEILCYSMLITTYIVGYLTFHFTIREESKTKWLRYFEPVNKTSFSWLHLGFLMLTIGACILTLLMTGRGITDWLSDPGGSSQDREGAGVATILLIFTSGLAFSSAGHYLIKTKFKLIAGIFYLLFLTFVYLFHIGRGKLLTYLMYLFLVPLFNAKMKIKVLVPFVVLLFGSIGIATYIRAEEGTASNSKEAVEFALNYFDTYHALYKSVKYEEPELFSTTFMAFNKFRTPFGYTDDIYYTVSAKFTPVHFPGYGRRTTVQFPIETDLYLGTYYVLGVPFLILYFYMIAYFYNVAISTNSIAFKYVAAVLLLQLVSHLRGMLFDWTDLYNYPILFVSFYLLHHHEVSKRGINVKALPSQEELYRE